MKPYLRLILLFVTLLPLTATGGTAYKWTDADGVVHYGDKKPDDATSTPIKIKNSKDYSLPSQTKNTDDKTTPEGTNKEKPTEQQAADDKVRKAACDGARENLATMKTYARIRIKDAETGELRYLTPEEKSQKEAESNKFIQENCK